MPMTGFGTRFFSLLATPRFWEKMDWTFRGSLLTVVPTMILSLNPSTKELIPVPSLFAFMAFWITMPTFGSGLSELVLLCKGFILSGILLVIVIWGIQPGPAWFSLILLFLFSVFYSFIGDVFKKNTAYLFTSTLMEYINNPSNGLKYLVDSYITTAISLCFGVFAFIVPFIRWSSEHARHYTESWGNALSISVQGTCSSFWVERPIERELNLVHLRQLRATAEMCKKKVSASLSESEYEPHTGSYMAKMTSRYDFCQRIHNVLGSMQHLIELLTSNPSLVDTPMCNSFGSLLQDDLTIIASAMDSMILKIVDFKRLVTKSEIAFFKEARQRFQDAVSAVREDVILNNENYEVEVADVYLGYFLFSVDELCEIICSFEEVEKPRNNFVHNLLFLVRDTKAVWRHTKHLYFHLVHEWGLTRRAKEAIKLALCMSLPGAFQIYALDNNSTSPLAGASVIALLYHATGAESFHYASNRLLGTVLGSLLSLVAVEIANGKLWLLYICIIIFSFVGAYVQAAPGFYALGNSIVCSTISIMTQYNNNSAAMERIKQNCFAILVYFSIVSILWPMRAHTKVKMGLDTSLRCIRETCTSLLRNLDMPEDAAEVSADTAALLKELDKKIAAQVKFIPGAVEEPTLGSVEYPEHQWWRIVDAERNLLSTLNMMRSAYRIFMSKRDVETAISVHWVVLHRIAPFASDLADLIHAMVDLHLLLVQRTTVVPISHLTRLRLAMQEAHKAIIEMYILTLQKKVDGEDEEQVEDFVEEVEERDEWDYSMELYNRSNSMQIGGPALSEGRASHDSGMPSAAAIQSATENKMTKRHSLRGEAPTAVSMGEDQNKVDSLNSAIFSPPDLSALPMAQSPPQHSSARVSKPAPLSDATLRERRGDGGKTADHNHKGDAESIPPDAEDAAQTFPPRSTKAKKKTMMAMGTTPNTSAGLAETKGPAKEKKRSGYLTYKLTPEEEKALRSFLQARRSGGSDIESMPTVSNMSFSPTMNMSFIANAGNNLMMNEARLLASRAEDDSLAVKLRKKHKIKVERLEADTEENNSDAEEGDEKKNTTKKRKKGRRSNTIGASDDTGKGKDLEDDDDDDDDEDSNDDDDDDSDTHHHHDDDDESSVNGKSEKEKDAKVSSGAIPMSNASFLMAKPFFSRLFKNANLKFKDDGSAVAGETEVAGALASSTENSLVERSAARKRRSAAGHSTENSEEEDDDDENGGALRLPHHSSDVGGTSPSLSTPKGKRKTKGSRRPSITVSLTEERRKRKKQKGRSSSSQSHSDDNHEDDDGDDERGDEGEYHDHEPHLGSTRKKGDLPPPVPRDGGRSGGTATSTTARSPGALEEKSLGRISGYGSGTEPDTIPARSNAAPLSGSSSTGAGDHVPLLRKQMKAAASKSALQPQEPYYRPTGRSDGSGSVLSGSSSGANGSGEGALEELSFFDEDRGDFVLTNSDIHSLEAFFFGTRALVVYLHDLQRAIIDMQHQYDLNKKL